MWKSSVTEMDKYFSWFDRFHVRKHYHTSMVTPGGPDFDETPGRPRPSVSESPTQILDSGEIQRFKNQFQLDADTALQDAKRAHHGYATGGVPIWLWIVFFWFAYDDLWDYFQSPLVFWPVMTICMGLGAIYSMVGGGIITQVIMPTARGSVNMGLRKIGVPFQV